MIVKIWPIKADYAGKRGKVGGRQGLKNTVDYISDPEKTNSEIVMRIHVSDMQKGSFINQEKDMHRLIRYMANEDKIEGKYISGYQCNPLLAAEEFERVMLHYGTQAKGNIAYHMVQSFPEELDIPDEEVHQCGLELCRRLGLYQAVVCSHVHPVLDDEGVFHGNCKHNHILFNAYPLPSMRDPNAKGPLKYHDCKSTYRQLQIWNDEIAIEHGLPIVRTPDMQRTYSWSEVDALQKGVSWKEMIRMDIENARKTASSWGEFVSIMKGKGYQIREGKQITYLAPDGQHRARGNTLGQNYTKEGLESYWELLEHMLENVEVGVKDNASPSLHSLIKMGAKTVSVPLGMQGLQNRSSYPLALNRDPIAEDTLYTYFEHNKLYDICDEQGNVIAALPGEKIIEYYLDKDSDRERNIRAEEADNAHNKQDEEAYKRKQQQEADEKKDFYSNWLFQNSQTKKPYKVRFYDARGRRISSVEAMFYLAIVVLKNEDELWMPTTIPPDKMNEACYATTNWKLQNMLDSIRIAREENIETPADVEHRLKNVGAAYSRARASVQRNTHVKEKMEDLKKAILAYEKTREQVESIYNIPEGSEKEEQKKLYNETLDQYKTAKAIMYAHGFKSDTLEVQIIDFKKRWRHMENNIRIANQQYDDTREEYRRLKKLQYNMALAENTKYCYGPAYEAESRTREQNSRQRTD